MNSKRVIFKWLAAVLIIVSLLRFALITPSASAQGEETATPTPFPSDRIACYGGTSDVVCAEDTNNYIRMEIGQGSDYGGSGGGGGDVHLRFLLLPSNTPRNIYVRVYVNDGGHI